MSQNNLKNLKIITENLQSKTNDVPLNEGTFSTEIAKATPTTAKPPITKK